jgi:hypothetical protein
MIHHVTETVTIPRNRLIPRNTELPTLVRAPLLFLRRYWLPLFLLLCGAVLDALTTYVNVRDFGADIEVHPVQRFVMTLFGPALGVPAAKAGQLFFVVAVAAWWRPWCGWLLALCGCFYGLAAASNHFLWL